MSEEHQYKRIVCNQSYFTKYDDLCCCLDNDLCTLREFMNPEIKAMRKCYTIKVKIYQDKIRQKEEYYKKFKTVEQVNKQIDNILRFVYKIGEKK